MELERSKACVSHQNPRHLASQWEALMESPNPPPDQVNILPNPQLQSSMQPALSGSGTSDHVNCLALEPLQSASREKDFRASRVFAEAATDTAGSALFVPPKEPLGML